MHLLKKDEINEGKKYIWSPYADLKGDWSYRVQPKFTLKITVNDVKGISTPDTDS